MIQVQCRKIQFELKSRESNTTITFLIAVRSKHGKAPSNNILNPLYYVYRENNASSPISFHFDFPLLLNAGGA